MLYRKEMCNKKYICLECNEKLDTLKKLSAHIRIKHNLTREIYYSKHLYKSGDGICPICGNFTKFLNLENLMLSFIAFSM